MSETKDILIVNEEMAAALVSRELAFAAAREAFIASSDGSGEANPVVFGRGFKEGERLSIKSGACRSSSVIGVKVGAYWPGAELHGLPRHGASTLLLDHETGRARALIASSVVNCFRTAAADAVAASALARATSKTLTIVGAGNQARYEADALADVFSLERVLIVSRTAQRGEALRALLAESLPHAVVECSALADAVRAADIVVAVTTARAPLFEADLVQPGAHVVSMGSDQAGKQELPVELFERARLFCDDPEQSIVTGEFQHIREAITRGRLSVTAIGDVLRGVARGRESEADITVFDSSGLALQDLCVAARIASLAQERS